MSEDRGTPSIALTTFSRASLTRQVGTSVEEILSKVDRETSTWIHIANADVAAITKILEHFALPRSLAEQIDKPATLGLDTSSDRYLFKNFRFIEQAPPGNADSRETRPAGVLIRGSETARLEEGSGSIIVGASFVLLFEHQQASPLLARAASSVLRRERELKERGIEYLLYRLTKSLFLENYFGLMRRLLDRLQELEAALLEGSTETKVYREVTRLRRELNPFERSLMHAAEFAAEVTGENVPIHGGLRHLAGSLGSDCARLEKELSMLRDRTSELIQTYRDNVSAELNNVMRSLTVISAMFLPLSFITSFYGMNFPHLPVFNWPGGFLIAVALMLAIAVGALTYARRKKWI